ncbi:outer membrane protein [Rhodovulum strictum]|nr:outer membrane beta-barrel protein [Rhodovulum strictum]
MNTASLVVAAGLALTVTAEAVQAQSAFDGAYFGFGIGKGNAETGQEGTSLEMPDAKGAIGSALVGYTASTGALVYGVEADIAKTNMDGTGTCNLRPCSAEVKSLASVRARAGVVAADTLIYATAGAATAKVDLTAQDSLGGDHSDDKRVKGWVAGVGVERPVADGWNLRGEVMRYGFRKRDYDLDVPYTNMKTDMTAARVALTHRF